MGVRGVHHLVVLVDDVPDGEAFFGELFDMEVLFREGSLDGTPGTVPDGMDWEDARSKGVAPYMSFLGRDDFFLAVAGGDRDDSGGRFDHVALAVDESTLESVAGRAAELGCSVDRNASHQLFVEGRFGVEWELNAEPRPPSRAFDTLDV